MTGVTFYMLDEDHNVTTTEDGLEWTEWFGNADRHVALSAVGEYTVSTVFLGIDHSLSDSAPVLFETMAFRGDNDDLYSERYSTWDEAAAGHFKVCERLENGEWC